MPGRGQYWKKGGLNDETVKEEDLSQALQTKVNSGGGDNPLDVAFMEDEFIYNGDFPTENATLYREKYNLQDNPPTASIIADQGNAYASNIRFSVNTANLTSIQFSTLDTMQSPSGTTGTGELKLWDMNVKFVQSLNCASCLPNTNHIMGLMNTLGWNFANPADPLTDILEFSSAIAFAHDPSRSANWLLVSGGVDDPRNTVIDSGVPVLETEENTQRFEIDYKHIPDKVTFKINGNTVGTITDTVEDEKAIAIYSGTNNVTTGSNGLSLDYWSYRIEPRPTSQKT